MEGKIKHDYPTRMGLDCILRLCEGAPNYGELKSLSNTLIARIPLDPLNDRKAAPIYQYDFDKFILLSNWAIKFVNESKELQNV